MHTSGFGWPYSWPTTKKRKKDQLVRQIKEAAHEWAAGYPLGGHMDRIAANKVYELREEYDNLMEEE